MEPQRAGRAKKDSPLCLTAASPGTFLPQALRALTMVTGNLIRSARHRTLSWKRRGLRGRTGPSKRTTSSSWLRGSWPWRCLGLRQERRSWRRLFTSLRWERALGQLGWGRHTDPLLPSRPPAPGTLTSGELENVFCSWSLAEVRAKERCPETCRETRKARWRKGRDPSLTPSSWAPSSWATEGESEKQEGTPSIAPTLLKTKRGKDRKT